MLWAGNPGWTVAETARRNEDREWNTAFGQLRNGIVDDAPEAVVEGYCYVSRGTHGLRGTCRKRNGERRYPIHLFGKALALMRLDRVIVENHTSSADRATPSLESSSDEIERSYAEADHEDEEPLHAAR